MFTFHFSQFHILNSAKSEESQSYIRVTLDLLNIFAICGCSILQKGGSYMKSYFPNQSLPDVTTLQKGCSYMTRCIHFNYYRM